VNAVETNASTSYQIRFTEGSDAEHEIQHIYETLSGVPGVGHISLDSRTLQLSVTYDDAAVDEGTIGQRLTTAGYVVP
jgi:copper chaperone CopZ